MQCGSVSSVGGAVRLQDITDRLAEDEAEDDDDDDDDVCGAKAGETHSSGRWAGSAKLC